MYPLKIAIKSLLREKWINLLTSLTIGLALLVLSVSVFAIYNLGAIAKKLPEKLTIMVYLKDGLAEADIEKMKVQLEGERLVRSATYISRERAFRELKETLRGADFILEGLEENPLSASFEVKIRKDLFSRTAVEDLITRMRAMPFTDDVDYGKGFLDFIQAVLTAINIIGMFVAGLVFFSITFVIYSTIKILFYRRNDEIEIYKLLGATANFIRAPFLIEGGVIGFIGGVIGVAGAYAFSSVLFFQIGKNLPLVSSLAFPTELFALLPLAGGILGLFGSMAAIGRVKF